MVAFAAGFSWGGAGDALRVGVAEGAEALEVQPVRFVPERHQVLVVYDGRCGDGQVEKLLGIGRHRLQDGVPGVVDSVGYRAGRQGGAAAAQCPPGSVRQVGLLARWLHEGCADLFREGGELGSVVGADAGTPVFRAAWRAFSGSLPASGYRTWT
ncbi:hypothetical protein [Streptomyces sp. NPDC005017]|uniref:hypothetical protein n=1 Tax=Streptomyces sp. NPDC005017 TaxID=3364706 RepID=UPI0036AEAEBE